MSDTTGSSKHKEIPIGPRLKAVLKVAYKARRPVLLEGPTGIGKSEVLAEAAKELGIDFIVLDLSLLEPPDLVGLPVIEDGRTTYATPSILPRSGAGLLMLEELNRAERYIQQPALQLLTARTLHHYKLPEGWSTCAAINPEEGEYQVTPLDPAMRARFLHLTVRADREGWLEWARAKNIHPAVMQLATSHERMLEVVPPRSWTYVSDILHALSAEEIHDRLLLWDLLSGYLPPLWIDILLAQSSLLAPDDDIDVHGLLASFDKDKDMQATLKGWQREGKTDRLQQVGLRVKSVIEGPELGALYGQGLFSMDAFESFLAMLPGDTRETLQEAFGYNPLSSLCLSFDFEGFLRNHKSSSLQKKLQRWKGDPAAYRHRWLSCQTSLSQHLELLSNLSELRRKNTFKRSLGWVLGEIGEDAMPLAKTLKRLNIEPIAPR